MREKRIKFYKKEIKIKKNAKLAFFVYKTILKIEKVDGKMGFGIKMYENAVCTITQ
jgi:hypothetical protein